MLVPVLFALIAGALAAPQMSLYIRPPPPPPPPFFDNTMGLHLSPYFNADIFDTHRFWGDLSREMKQLDDMLADLSKRFPSGVSSQGIIGNEYHIEITLNGFDEKDIVVKAREGMFMMQAVHKDGNNNQNSYLDVRSLPDNIDVNGTWTFQNNVLTVVFPLKEEAKKPVVTTEEPVFVNTESNIPQSREEMDTQKGEDNQDADVGLRGDDVASNRKEIISNEIPRLPVEATTYAVDLKDEVEFVPLKQI